MTLMVEPLRFQLRAHLAETRTTNVELARRYVRRFGDEEDRARHKLEHLLTDARTIEDDAADSWCVLLDIHPTELWPEWEVFEDE